MGFRFSKTKSFGKLFRVTISKSGVSASVGVPGYRKTFSKKGVKTTLSIPGTGLSHSTMNWRKQAASSATPSSPPQVSSQATVQSAPVTLTAPVQQTAQHRPSVIKWIIALVVLGYLLSRFIT